jgi:hypothetical protein
VLFAFGIDHVVAQAACGDESCILRHVPRPLKKFARLKKPRNEAVSDELELVLGERCSVLEV